MNVDCQILKWISHKVSLKNRPLAKRLERPKPNVFGHKQESNDRVTLSGIREKESEWGDFGGFWAAVPFTERGRQPKGAEKVVSQEKRHCQSGKYAFESAKLAKFFGRLNFDKTLTQINKLEKQNKQK